MTINILNDRLPDLYNKPDVLFQQCENFQQGLYKSDGVLIFVERTFPRFKVNVLKIKSKNIPFIVTPTPENFSKWLSINKINDLLIYGNTENESPNINKRIAKLLRQSLE